MQQVLMLKAQKRMQSPLNLNDISPHLAAIQSSCIIMPGHTQQDEVNNSALSVIYNSYMYYHNYKYMYNNNYNNIMAWTRYRVIVR